MTTVVYTKVGPAKSGTIRVWMEGQKIRRAGIEPGDRFNVQSEGQIIRLTFTPDGERTVSRRKSGDNLLPLIEVKGKQLEKAFAKDDRVRVVIKNGSIELSLHHQQRTKVSREHRLITKLKAGEPLSIGSICHGGGILSNALHAGLARQGISSHLASAVEIESAYLEMSLRNNPVWDSQSVAVHAPMQDVEWRFMPKVDILEAGIPCTGASLSGRSRNRLAFAEAHETAGSLFIAFLNAVQVLKPSIVLLENVPMYAQTISMHVIRSVLKEMDYTVSEAILGGSDFGALENRQRLCMVAVSSGLRPVDMEQIQKSPGQPQKLGDIMDDVPLDDPMWKPYSYLAEKEKRDIEAGKGFRRQLLTPDAPEIGTIGRGYSKARSTEPFILHPQDDQLSRLLTVAEHARAKTIPHHLVQGESATRAHEVLGQSVIHSAFAAVGSLIAKTLHVAQDVPALAA